MSSMAACDSIRSYAVWIGILLSLFTVNGQESCSCGSVNNCIATEACAKPDNCSYKNVAFGKQASMTSLGTAGHVASLAVNGDTSTSFGTGTNINCAETWYGDSTPTWSVDLGQDYITSNITIYKRTEEFGPDRMADLTLKVGDQICHKFPTHNDMPAVEALPARIDIQCDPPLTGRTVKLEKANTYYNSSYYINVICLCEVQVWACDAGYYGNNCSPCGRCNQGQGSTCSPVSGHCPAGCQSGWKPPLCQECAEGYYGSECAACGFCKANATCNATNGICPSGCQAGYNGSLCKETCPNGTYGENCVGQCGQCTEGSTCNSVTGECAEGCQSGWQGSHCNKSCDSGRFGKNCSSQCGQCSESSTCDPVTGKCQGCQPGWQGTYCNETCDIGRYGANCTSECGHCKDNSTCNTTTGVCEDGCTDFYYGALCTSACGQCKDNGTCDKTTGECKDGCEEGFEGLQCMAEASTSAGKDANIPLIVGLVVGVLGLLAIAAAVVFIVRRRQKGTKENSDDQEESRRITEARGSLPFAPIEEQESNKKKKAKPSAAVKPTRLRPTETHDDESAHIYVNRMVSLSEEDNTLAAPAGTPLAAAGRSEFPSSVTARAGIAWEASVEQNEFEEDALPPDGDGMYHNDDKVYATFKASRPELDSVQRYLVDRLASGQLRIVFKDLAAGADLPREVANWDTNFKKNRFASIQPYDSNRVVLHDGYDRDGATDFVNASYISGYDSEKAFIAAQGPRDNTVADFWRMVWQERITHIVMLTNLKEAGKNKCYEYWPGRKSSQTHGPVKVIGLDEEHRASFVIRTFRLKFLQTREEREVVQYQYVSWPDHDAPITTSLIMFWRFVMARAARSSTHAPLLVHCSAGVGRTGSFIGLDIGFNMAIREGKLDVPALVKRMRDQRCWMVQAAEQFLFLHKALLEAYTARDTFRTIGDFAASFPGTVNVDSPNPRIDREFKTLLQMRALAEEQTHDFADEVDNITKNRNPDVLPLDDHLVYLTEQVSGRNQYINAVYFSTFWQEKGCILTQLPLPNTLVDFWRLVYGDGVQTIVSLAPKDEEQELTPYCWYWPRAEGETIKTGPYTVQFQFQSQIGDFITSYILKLDKEGVASSRDVRVLRYEDWTGDVPANTSDLLHLVDALDNVRTDGRGPPVVVQCSDGMSKSGLFCVICNVIHRMRCDREVDVYMAVRHVQNVRPHAVTSEMQYRFLYDLAQQQAAEMTVYANT